MDSHTHTLLTASAHKLIKFSYDAVIHKTTDVYVTQQLDRTAVNLEAKRNEKPNKAPSTILLTSANTTAAAAAAAHQNATFCPHMIKNNNHCCALRRPLTSGRMFTAIFPSTLNASNFFLLFPTAVKDRKPVSLGLLSLSLSLSLCVQSVPPCPVLE